MLVDGEQIDGNIAPLFVAGTVHRIQVELHAPGVRKESGT
jgi:hypothetical protein